MTPRKCKGEDAEALPFQIGEIEPIEIEEEEEVQFDAGMKQDETRSIYCLHFV